MKKGFFVFVLFIIFFISMQFVSAEIILSQPGSFYSLGDSLTLSVEVSEIKTGFLEINLGCDSNTKNIYNSIISKKKTDITIPLTRTYINELAGQCKVIANYGGEQASSSGFKISNNIIISIDVEKLSVKPGQEIEIKGTATKENRALVNGFIEIKIEDAGISVLRNVVKGEFDIKISLPADMQGKEYVLSVNVYEKSGEEITNQGIVNKALVVQQIPSKIDVTIDKQSTIPGNEISFKAILYDQANKEIQGDINVVIRNPEEDSILSETISSGEPRNFNIEKNFTAGYWTIEASSLEVNAKRLFYVEEDEEAEFKIENQTLIITNVGNVPYQKAVQIVIGDQLEIRQIDLDIGEEISFRLAAPDGAYNIKVTDGSKTLEFSEISLTGNVIDVMSIRKASGALGRYPIVWLFLIIVFALFILMLVNRIVKKRFVGKIPSFKKAENDKRGEITNFDGEAEHTMVLKGNKEQATILALKSADKKAREVAVNKIKAGKGAIYSSGEYLLGIFTPSLTKTMENELSAVKIAREIKEALRGKEFGIGINTGSIITEKQGGKLKFTSLGNTLALAKKIADTSKGEVLLSSSSSKKAGSVIKSEKKGENYEVNRVVDRDKYKKFVDDFLKKNK